MIKFRIFIFLIFCILHQWGILDAASVKRDSSKESQGSSKVCQTPECKRAASTIQHSIDLNVAPCDDFYKFACGNFLKTAVVSEGETFVDRYNSLDQKNKELLKKNLEEPIQHNEPRFITLSKNYYKACMDEAGIEKNGIRTMSEQLKKLGGWPVVVGDSWQEKKFSWIQATYDFHNFGHEMYYFFNVICNVDYKNSSRNILIIDQPYLSLEAEFSLKGFNDKVVKAYYDLMVDLAVIFGANRPRAERELKDVINFLIKLGSITETSGNEGTAEFPVTQMTVKELTKKYPIVPWKEYFNTFLKPNVEIGDDEVITVNHPNFFEKFNALMKQQIPKRVLANYLFFEAVQEVITYSSKELMEPFLKYAKIRWGPDGGNLGTSWMGCIEDTFNRLSISTGALFVRKNLNEKSKKNVRELAVAIEEQLKKALNELDWMDGKTKTSAWDKLKSMKTFIGSFDQLSNDKFIDEYYKKLEIPSNNYVQAHLNVNLFETNRFLRELRMPPKKSDWPLLIHSETYGTNAEYDGESNSIVITAGILRDIFFNENRPQYLNFAGIGSFNFANKIIRAIDNDGRYSDKNGYPKDWWTSETNKRYLRKSACINQQYANYTFKEGGFKVNDKSMVEKNIADNGGVKMAYQAYQDWVKLHGPEPTLPGLKYSQSQLFWIQAAVTQCGKYTPEYSQSVESINEFNSPSEFRVSGLFANRPEFAADFNCKVGSKMNPVKKCSEW